MNLFSHVEKKVFTVQHIKYNIIFFFKSCKDKFYLNFFPPLSSSLEKKERFHLFPHRKNFFFLLKEKTVFTYEKNILFKIGSTRGKKKSGKINNFFLVKFFFHSIHFFFPLTDFFFLPHSTDKKKKRMLEKRRIPLC